MFIETDHWKMELESNIQIIIIIIIKSKLFEHFTKGGFYKCHRKVLPYWGIY